MDDFRIIYKGKEYNLHRSKNFGLSDYWTCTDNKPCSGLYECIDAVAHYLKEIGCEDYIVNAVEEKCKYDYTYLDLIADRTESRNMSVEDAENAFNKRYTESNKFFADEISVNDPYYDSDYDDYLTEEERVVNSIYRHIGWEIKKDIWNSNNYIDRQHMCVICDTGFGQIEPQWYMRYNRPDMLDSVLDLDKIIDNVRLEMANEECEDLEFAE